MNLIIFNKNLLMKKMLIFKQELVKSVRQQTSKNVLAVIFDEIYFRINGVVAPTSGRKSSMRKAKWEMN
jgi:hypothetical protein